MKIIFFILGFLFFGNALATDFLPPRFFVHKDVLIETLKETWSDIKIPSALAGQIEQETCYSLKSKRCWSIYATLKTEREYGFGLGQITITKRFNTFEEIKKLDERLKDWKFEDRFNAKNQILALVLMMKRNYNVFKFSEEEIDRFAFALAAYNGGLGGILSDRKICKNTKDCNPNLWFNNVENTSLKKKTKISGYGKSFFEINREYPRNILFVRRHKYKMYIDPHFKEVIY